MTATSRLGRRSVYNLHIVNDARYAELNARLIVLMSTVKPAGTPPHAASFPVLS